MSDRRPFSRYLSETLVETGSYQGDGIQTALDCGYKNVYSYEISPQLHTLCKNRFKDDNRVHLFQKSSVKMAEDLREIKGRITFWLDAHYSAGSATYSDKPCPIMEELGQIAMLPRKDHTILIDDFRLFQTSEFNYLQVSSVQEKILKINPKYQFRFENGYIPGDVLLAYVEEDVPSIQIDSEIALKFLEEQKNMGDILEIFPVDPESTILRGISELRKDGEITYESYTIVSKDRVGIEKNIKKYRVYDAKVSEEIPERSFTTVIAHTHSTPHIANASILITGCPSDLVKRKCTLHKNLYVYPSPPRRD